jgi:hypothetical protein
MNKRRKRDREIQITESTRDILKFTASSKGQEQKGQTKELVHEENDGWKKPSSQILPYTGYELDEC